MNLTKLMSPTSWMWILASLVSVTFCFNIASRFVSRKMRMKLENIEIDLYPFRYIDYYLISLFLHLHKCYISCKYRVYIPYRPNLARVRDRSRSLHSFNILQILWAVCGGFFITNFLLCNYLPVLVKRVFEKPAETAQVTKHL